MWNTRLRPVFDPADASPQTQGLITYEYMHDYLNERAPRHAEWVDLRRRDALRACFHFANGLWGFLIHWGITVGPRAQRAQRVRLRRASASLLAALGLNSLFAFVS